MKKYLPILFLLYAIIFFLSITLSENSSAFLGWKTGVKTVGKIIKLGKSEGALPEKKIIELAEKIRVRGDVSDVRKMIGRMNLPDGVAADTFMRIAVHNKRLTRAEAEKMFVNLRRTKGFRAALSKINGVSPLQRKGHLNELRIANHGSENGFKVLAIGKKFDDGIKKNLTDIDVLFKKKNKTFAVEAKNWRNVVTGNLIEIRKDMDSLVAYKRKADSDANLIFTFRNKPSDPKVKRMIDMEARKRGIEVIYGDPASVIYQIDQLSSIL